MVDEPGDEPPAKVQSNEHVKAYFLDLAAKGKDAWNEWRRDPANKDVPVTFAGINFSEEPRDRINFEGFEFGDHADFSGCKWRGARAATDPKTFAFGRPCFNHASFGVGASFNSTVFGGAAFFENATFGTIANFACAAFEGGASFTGADFDAGARFTCADFGGCAYFKGSTVFGDSVSFDYTTFGSGVLFDNAFFYGDATFKGAAFSDQASFVHTIIQGRAEFTAMSAGKWRDDLRATVIGMNSEAGRALEQRHEESWARCGCHPDRFLGISFANALFGGEATFFGRSFEKITDFINVRFYSPPNFDSGTNLARIDFTGAHVGFVGPGRFQWTSDSKVPLRLRALRKLAEETKNHDLERDLYIEERKAERGVYWCQWRKALKREPNWALKGIALLKLFHAGLWIFVMGLYWILADYGRSLMRPFGALIASGFFFYWCYTEVLAQLMAKAPDIEKYKQAVRMLALGNTVPFVGPLTIDSKVKEFLFCPCRNCPDPLIPPEGYQWLVLGQNLFSITCVFFIGLALRNYFKIK